MEDGGDMIQEIKDELTNSDLIKTIELESLLELWERPPTIKFLTEPYRVINKESAVVLLFYKLNPFWIRLSCFCIWQNGGDLQYPNAKSVHLFLKFIEPEKNDGYLYLTDLGEATNNLCKSSRFESYDQVYARYSYLCDTSENDKYRHLATDLSKNGITYLNGYLEGTAHLKPGREEIGAKIIQMLCAAWQIGQFSTDEEFCQHGYQIKQVTVEENHG